MAPTAAMRFIAVAARILLVLLLIAPASQGSRGSRVQMAQEYAVKASFITKFVVFIRWSDPAAGKADSAEPFIVSILGPDPFQGELGAAFRNADLGGRRVRIRVVDKVEDLAGSRVVFISAAAGNRLEPAVRWSTANGALTIGDGVGFAEKGVVINFFLRDDKVRFEINPKAAERSGLQVSSLLLKVARIVGES